MDTKENLLSETWNAIESHLLQKVITRDLWKAKLDESGLSSTGETLEQPSKTWSHEPYKKARRDILQRLVGAMGWGLRRADSGD